MVETLFGAVVFALLLPHATNTTLATTHDPTRDPLTNAAYLQPARRLSRIHIGGAQLEPIQNLMDPTTGRPTAARGFMLHWRVGADCIDPDAFRVLYS